VFGVVGQREGAAEGGHGALTTHHLQLERRGAAARRSSSSSSSKRKRVSQMVYDVCRTSVWHTYYGTVQQLPSCSTSCKQVCCCQRHALPKLMLTQATAHACRHTHDLLLHTPAWPSRSF
jgi:hypothetical protein